MYLRSTGMIRDIAYLRQGQYIIFSDLLSALKGDIDIGEEVYFHQCNMYHCGCIEPKSRCPKYCKGLGCMFGEKENQAVEPMSTLYPLIDGNSLVTESSMKV